MALALRHVGLDQDVGMNQELSPNLVPILKLSCLLRGVGTARRGAY